MKLMIGGFAQGKLTACIDSIKNNNSIPEEKIQVIDETELTDSVREDALAVVINHLHLIFRQDEDQAEILLKSMQTSCEQSRILLVVISDEIGNGIVPLDREERMYRENLGRLLCRLAKEADEVERVICQIPQKIK